MVNMKSWGSGVSLVCKEYQQFYVEPTPITPLRGPTCPFYCFLVRLCAGLCHLVRLYAIFCGLMPSCVGLCRLVLACAILCALVPSYFILCHLVSSCATLCHLVPPCAIAWCCAASSATWTACANFFAFGLVSALVPQGDRASGCENSPRATS